MPIISINGNTLDPDTPVPALRTLNLVQDTAQDSNYILIQTNGPLTKDIKRGLAEAQVTVQEKVSDDTYLCKYEPEDLSPVRELPYVTYCNIYQPHFVVDAHLKQTPPGSSHAHPLLPVAPRTTDPVTVDVEFHPDVQVTDDLVKEVAAKAHLDEETLNPEAHKIRMSVEYRYLNDLAVLDAVKSIHEVHPVRLLNNVARNILRAHEAINPINGTQYEGEGQVVCVSDTGFDKGSLDPKDVHLAFITNGVVRVKHLYALGRKPIRKANGTVIPGKASDPSGHGSHVCGSVLGDGYSDKMGGRIQGTAPKATLVMQSLLDGAGYLSGIPDDLHNLFEPPYKEHDARIHTNSWGSSPRPWYQIKYDDSAKEIDDFVYTHRDMVILFAAGNDGMDVKPKDGAVDLAQIGSQAAAKNCISVGASESIRPELNRKYSMWGYPKQPLAGDNVANDAEGMAAFSSRGPTVEGRIKPDVVAPGTCILSTRSSVAEDSGGWGKSTDDRFCFEGGTSMATPLVAGCCAVLRESLVKNGVPAPSAALIKALLINGAVELAGQYNPSEAGPSPNFASGWGRVDVANSLVVPADDAPVTGPAAATTPSPIRVSADGTAGFADESAATAVDTFEEFTFTITIKAPASGTVRPPTNGQAKDVAARGPGSVAAKAVQTPALKVTLVWTDPAGEKLQNDLDLIVVAGDVERHGNQGTKTFPVKTKKDRDDEDHAITTPAGHAKEPFDRQNNVEQVVWANIPEGDVTVIVRGHNVTSLDGQTFAVAWKVYY